MTADPQPTVRVLLVDDDPLVRAGLVMMLDGADGIRVVGEAADGADVPSQVDQTSPDVVLMDIRMGTIDGLTATETLRRRPEPPEVLILTTFDADTHVLRALRAGAAGFLLKDTPPPEIAAAIRAVAAHRPVLSEPVLRRLIDRATDRGDSRRDRATALLDRLNDREREIAVHVGHGKSNARIAADVYLSVPTVKTHVSAILSKLDLNNRVQIALLVHDAGLLDSNPPDHMPFPPDQLSGDGPYGGRTTP